MPQGNWLKGLQTKWRLFQAVLRADSQPDKAAPAEQSLIDEVGLFLLQLQLAHSRLPDLSDLSARLICNDSIAAVFSRFNALRGSFCYMRLHMHAARASRQGCLGPVYTQLTAQHGTSTLLARAWLQLDGQKCRLMVLGG